MAQGLLQSEGIEALVEDAHLSSMDPLVRLAISGAKLLVPIADVDKARELLAAAGVALRGGHRPSQRRFRRRSGRSRPRRSSPRRLRQR